MSLHIERDKFWIRENDPSVRFIVWNDQNKTSVQISNKSCLSNLSHLMLMGNNHLWFFSCRTERIDGGRLFLVVYLGSMFIQLPSPALPGLAVCRWGQGLSDQGSGHTPRWENQVPHVVTHQKSVIRFHHTRDFAGLFCLPASFPLSCPVSRQKLPNSTVLDARLWQSQPAADDAVLTTGRPWHQRLHSTPGDPPHATVDKAGPVPLQQPQWPLH